MLSSMQLLWLYSRSQTAHHLLMSHTTASLCIRRVCKYLCSNTNKIFWPVNTSFRILLKTCSPKFPLALSTLPWVAKSSDSCFRVSSFIIIYICFTNSSESCLVGPPVPSHFFLFVTVARWLRVFITKTKQNPSHFTSESLPAHLFQHPNRFCTLQYSTSQLNRYHRDNDAVCARFEMLLP